MITYISNNRRYYLIDHIEGRELSLFQAAVRHLTDCKIDILADLEVQEDVYPEVENAIREDVDTLRKMDQAITIVIDRSY